jgi:hypothetical protein
LIIFLFFDAFLNIHFISANQLLIFRKNEKIKNVSKNKNLNIGMNNEKMI